MKRYVMTQLGGPSAAVVEKPTSAVVFAGRPDEARHVARFANGGGGFNGNTPHFMFERVQGGPAQWGVYPGYMNGEGTRD